MWHRAEKLFSVSVCFAGERTGRKRNRDFQTQKKPFPEREDFFPEAVSYRVSALSKCSFRTLMDSLN